MKQTKLTFDDYSEIYHDYQSIKKFYEADVKLYKMRKAAEESSQEEP